MVRNGVPTHHPSFKRVRRSSTFLAQSLVIIRLPFESMSCVCLFIGLAHDRRIFIFFIAFLLAEKLQRVLAGPEEKSMALRSESAFLALHLCIHTFIVTSIGKTSFAVRRCPLETIGIFVAKNVFPFSQTKNFIFSQLFVFVLRKFCLVLQKKYSFNLCKRLCPFLQS